WRKSPTPLDQLQNRSVVEHWRADSGISRIPTAEWRRDNRGDAQAKQRFTFHEIGIHVVGRGGTRRSDMLEEAAPFVKVHNENRVGPLWAVGYGLESFVED